jgi:uncharacterized membrane protein
MGLFTKNLIDDNFIKEISAAIQWAEKNTSGEIRVHIEAECKKDVLQRATEVFEELNMTQTAQRNGVLIYLALHDKVFAIVGDEGIHQKVPANFWEDIKAEMLTHFTQHHIKEGIIAAIQRAGEKLKEFFPYEKGDTNELSDEVSFE